MNRSFKQIKRLTPIAFWIFQILVHIIRNLHVLSEKPFSYILLSIQYTFPLDFITFCVFYFVFAPKFFRKEKTVLYISLTVLYFIIFSFIWVFVYYLQGEPNDVLYTIYASSMGHNLMYAFYGIIIRMAIDWFEKREERKEIEKQHIKTELALLRSQINPHFLFNTLNNINSFAQTEPDKTSYAVIKLSDIMRYMLYEAGGDKVLLTKEINYIHNYLDLQKLRFENQNFIEFKIGDIPANIFVSPMLFIPFIENAFKHGKKTGDNMIKIELLYREKQLFFTCVNKKRELNETEKKAEKGIGIENIKRRLKLIYPEKHQLEISDTETDFKVKLNIDLS